MMRENYAPNLDPAIKVAMDSLWEAGMLEPESVDYYIKPDMLAWNLLEVAFTAALPELTRLIQKRQSEKLRRINMELEAALNDRFEDGSFVMEYVLAANPELKERLRSWIESLGD